MTKPIALTIAEATKAAGISRSLLYVAIKRRQLRAVKAGRRTLIPYEALEAFIANLPAFEGDTSPNEVKEAQR